MVARGKLYHLQIDCKSIQKAGLIIWLFIIYFMHPSTFHVKRAKQASTYFANVIFCCDTTLTKWQISCRIGNEIVSFYWTGHALQKIKRYYMFVFTNHVQYWETALWYVKMVPTTLHRIFVCFNMCLHNALYRLILGVSRKGYKMGWKN